MIGFLARRALGAVLLVFAVTSGALLLAQFAPGDYASQFGQNAAQLAAERHRLGLDLPVGRQYARWLKRSITLDLGESFQYQRPVAALVGEKALNTAKLATTALLVATLIGIPWGVVTGSRRGGLLIRALRGASLVLLSVPPLISSLVLLTIAARTGWLPVSGMGGISHLIVPTLALALPIAAVLERLQSQSIADVLARPAAVAAQARGIPRGRIVWRHGWRQSLGPILAIYGIIIGTLFSGSFAVEIVTSWPGLGELMRQALISRDTYLVAGCAAAGAAFLAAGVLVADVAHALADPRVDTRRA
ncbi:MAG TPA: ABC transporter permease [Vicinamibacterales bacterium]|nr:ABC transporter permease [Vicinamibacterales bacterium]